MKRIFLLLLLLLLLPALYFGTWFLVELIQDVTSKFYGGFHGGGWVYAYFWNHKLVAPNPNRFIPTYRMGFQEILAEVSPETLISPSGEKVYLVERTPILEKLFTWNPKVLVYLYLSKVSGSSLPDGLKAFTPDVESGAGKKDGLPVVWIAPEMLGQIHPGAHFLLLVPRKHFRRLVNFLVKRKYLSSNGLDWITAGPYDPDIEVNSGRKLILSNFYHLNKNLQNGKRVYGENCAGCHGTAGNGQGPASMFLYPKPRDFTSAEFKFKTTAGEELPADSDLYRSIGNGIPGTAMPAFLPALLPDEIRDVAAYIKQFAVDPGTGKNLFIEHPPRQVIPFHLKEVDDWFRGYSSAVDHGQLFSIRYKRGKELYFTKGKCQDCHGPGPESKDRLPHGDGQYAEGLKDDWGYPIQPPDLSQGIFKRGNTIEDVYVTITTGMPGTPMPSYQDNLTQEERWAIAFYVSNLNH